MYSRRDIRETTAAESPFPATAASFTEGGAACLSLSADKRSPLRKSSSRSVETAPADATVAGASALPSGWEDIASLAALSAEVTGATGLCCFCCSSRPFDVCGSSTISAATMATAATEAASQKAGVQKKRLRRAPASPATATPSTAATGCSGRLSAMTSRHWLHAEMCSSTWWRSTVGKSRSMYAVRVSASGCTCWASAAASLWLNKLDNSAISSQNPYLVGTQQNDFLSAFCSHPPVNTAHLSPKLLPPVHGSCPWPPGRPLPAF